jgi:hypothetical protein
MEANPQAEGTKDVVKAVDKDSPAKAAPDLGSKTEKDRRPLLTYGILGSASALAVWAALSLLPRTPVTPPVVHVPPPPPPISMPQPPPPPLARPQVDVVFALDTTGSMSALLDGAKRKIWEIARYIAQGQPAPELRIGLVAYRDVGDEYVTKFFDLTDDLDGVYQNLLSFSAGGGGDTPEHVAKALHEAVFRASWGPGKNTLKLVYLVGDAPPHTDYSDGFNFHAIAQQARERGIRINTVRCGNDDDTRVAWTEIANRSGGEFASIDQTGGMINVDTPYDRELARLNRSLTETALPYGSADKRSSILSKARKIFEAPPAAQADRAGFFGLSSRGGKASAVSEGDLLDDVSNKRVDLSRVEASALPEPMQAMPAEERGRFMEAKKKERTEILNQINTLSSQRDAYLRSRPAAPASGFDGKVRETLKKQAKSIAVEY